MCIRWMLIAILFTPAATESKVVGHSRPVWWVRYNQKGNKLLSYAADQYRGGNPEYCVWSCATGSLSHTSKDEPVTKIFDDLDERTDGYLQCINYERTVFRV
uniref:Uncharacterized protein n=1 Tax=Proboscia inermis TaxID=420281 RepID=A0A7S0CNA7_9STRA|mmetsp:Transcript_9975/g.10116  ORF Transcript_9975/g.10116 Transcript_9975/m.10116 type:complete len:102 (+) Transcript_9975:105-410(+)